MARQGAVTFENQEIIRASVLNLTDDYPAEPAFGEKLKLRDAVAKTLEDDSRITMCSEWGDPDQVHTGLFGKPVYATAVLCRVKDERILTEQEKADAFLWDGTYCFAAPEGEMFPREYYAIRNDDCFNMVFRIAWGAVTKDDEQGAACRQQGSAHCFSP